MKDDEEAMVMAGLSGVHVGGGAFKQVTWKRFFDSDAEECLLRPKLKYLKQEAEYLEGCVGRVTHIGTLNSEVASIMPRLGTVMLNRTNYRAVQRYTSSINIVTREKAFTYIYLIPSLSAYISLIASQCSPAENTSRNSNVVGAPSYTNPSLYA